MSDYGERRLKLSNRIQECNKRLDGLNKQLQDDLRYDVRKNVKSMIEFWNDELWVAINEKSILDENQLVAENKNHSNYN